MVTVRLWDINTKTEIAKLTGHEGVVRGVSFTPDGTLLVSGSEGHNCAVMGRQYKNRNR